MSSADVIRQTLTGRWPLDGHLHVPEVTLSSDRGGRRLDLLVVSCWPSRGLERDGVEIKVSVADWRRELRDVAKADEWWRVCHRFWLAAPPKIAAKIVDEVPPTWGLLAVDERQARVVTKAPRHEPDPIDWPGVVGIMRALSGASWNALRAAERKGFERGRERGRAEAAREAPAEQVVAELERLRSVVHSFSEASGIDLEHDARGRWDAGRLGRLARLAAEVLGDPSYVDGQLGTIAADLERTAATVADLRTALLPELSA